MLQSSDFTPLPPGRHGLGQGSRGTAKVPGVYIREDDSGCKEERAGEKIHSAGS